VLVTRRERVARPGAGPAGSGLDRGCGRGRGVGRGCNGVGSTFAGGLRMLFHDYAFRKGLGGIVVVVSLMVPPVSGFVPWSPARV